MGGSIGLVGQGSAYSISWLAWDLGTLALCLRPWTPWTP
jgi:hypothetical protein